MLEAKSHLDATIHLLKEAAWSFGTADAAHPVKGTVEKAAKL